ncbi:DNA repair protein RecN [Hyphococcus flavus]|uniref:DNA repair protein RecN n=1 Tax=Hyphococcus flavus TaxID=1866326 RepID=A0AAF0CEL7_9PROT|nr:DNA repair protein RecN [Hyphococcus flavus]WDI30404.1 DNA repair protein RecN [Hyphococcus flavus]
MLTALQIQDFVLIDQARLTLGAGMTALTGETGAGKSILLDALGLAVGGRAERGAVRQGAKQGIVSVIFEPQSNHPVWKVLEENGLDTGEDQVILRRVQGTDGRGRGFVNDQPVSIRMLRTVGETLIEIHGQHDGRGFLTASAHRGMLDEFGGLSKKADAMRALWRDWRDAEEALEEKKRERDAAIREADYLRHVVGALGKLDPQEDEEAELALRRAELMASDKIADDLNAAAAAMSDGGFDSKLAGALRRIERAAAQMSGDDNPLAKLAARLDSALNEAAEARSALDDAIARFGADPDELDRVEERLFALRAEARKHGVTPDGLCGFLEKARQTLDDLEQGEAAFGELEETMRKTKAAFEKEAKALSKARVEAAKKLDRAVAKELAPLKLGKAAFETKVASDESHPTSEGFDTVEFMVATNPGAPAGPLKTIASGGELSRFVLAMKAALSVKENRTVIIFDEVDAGVGGAVADAVGERLARLASDAQVLVVTHSPQVAARAGSHWRIEKKQTKSTTLTKVTPLEPSDREEEIARMLSGAEVTDEARAAARRLLKEPLDPNKTAKKPARKKLAKTG